MKPGRRGDGREFFARVTLEGDVARAAAAGGGLAVALWCALRAWAGPSARLEGQRAPSVPALCRLLRLSERTIQRHLAELEAVGMLSVERRSGRRSVLSLSIQETPAALTPPQNLRPTPAAATGDPRSIYGGPPQNLRPRRAEREERKREERERALPDLPAYLDALKELHPKLGLEDEVTNALAEQARQLPPLPQFIEVLTAWTQTREWQEEDGRFAPNAARWVSESGFKNAPKKAAPRPKPARTVDQVRSEDVRPALLAALRDGRLSRDLHDGLLDRCAVASTLAELGAIVAEIPQKVSA